MRVVDWQAELSVDFVGPRTEAGGTPLNEA